jgi:hypothetical protein
VLRSDGTYVRTPFPGNRIPADHINAIAAKLAKFYPAPNVVTGPDNIHNYAALHPQVQ